MRLARLQFRRDFEGSIGGLRVAAAESERDQFAVSSRLALEPEHLDARRRAVGEHHQRAARLKVDAGALARGERQPVESLAHVHRLGAHEDADLRGDHRAAPSTVK